MGKSGLSTWVPVWLHVTDSPPDANEAAAAVAFKMLEALPFSFSLPACQYLSCSLPFASPPILLQWFCLSISVSTHPFSSSSSVTPLFFFLQLPLTVSPSAPCASAVNSAGQCTRYMDSIYVSTVCHAVFYVQTHYINTVVWAETDVTSVFSGIFFQTFTLKKNAAGFDCSVQKPKAILKAKIRIRTRKRTILHNYQRSVSVCNITNIVCVQTPPPPRKTNKLAVGRAGSYQIIRK